jgi:hypothetical protein
MATKKPPNKPAKTPASSKSTKGVSAPRKEEETAVPRTAEETEVPLAPPEVDVAQFEAAYERVKPLAESLKAEELEQLNLDSQISALVALGVARTTHEPKMRQRFRNLAKSGEFDDKPVDALPDLAMAAWYARYRFRHSGGAVGTRVNELAKQGYALRSKMLRVLEYNLDDNPEVMRQITIIRAGSGYLDLANDLTAVADLYTTHASPLAQDTRRYHVSDVSLARRQASSLLNYVGGSNLPAPKGGWAEMQQRTWTLLLHNYDEVARGGQFLVPGPEGERLFPSLVAATRALSFSPATPKPAPPKSPSEPTK